MPYTFSAAEHDCPIAEFEAATMAFPLRFGTSEEKRTAYRRYVVAEKAKRDSGWQLPAEPY
jgi:hypothetical protein